MRALQVAVLVPLILLPLAVVSSSFATGAEPKGSANDADPVWKSLDAHIRNHPTGDVAFTWDQTRYRELTTGERADLPIGVFDSGIGGLTVLEALLTSDVFHNDTLQPGADGQPDFAGERFLYLGDQANMPYGNYPAQGREDYLRELILKDAVFLLGKRYHVPGPESPTVRDDKPPVKAIVIACNTATAYGLDDLRSALEQWRLPIPVIGVVEAGARGLMQTPGDGAVGVLATTGTCASGVYPRTISRTLGLAGRPQPVVSQWGSGRLAGVIEGDPAFATPVSEQTLTDVRALVEAHRDRMRDSGGPSTPLQKIVLGCTHFPLVTGELDAAFELLRQDPQFASWIAPCRSFVNPAEWTARELFRELATNQLRRDDTARTRAPTSQFFISVAHDGCPAAKLASPGVLDSNYKYQRRVGKLDIEDTLVIPMTRTRLPDVSRKLLRDKLPSVWRQLPE